MMKGLVVLVLLYGVFVVNCIGVLIRPKNMLNFVKHSAIRAELGANKWSVENLDESIEKIESVKAGVIAAV